MKSWLYNLLVPRHRKRSVRWLRELEYRLPSQRVRFAVPFVFRGAGHFRSLRPLQTPREIEALYNTVCELAPRRVLEIGTAKGGTLYLWTQAAMPDASLVSIDLPGGQFGGGYRACRADLYRAFAQPGQTMTLLRADSHAPDTLAEVRRLFGGQAVDFLFIDADHTYPGVKADFLQYGPLVRPGGLIAFHDILTAPHDPAIRVCELWDQFQGRFQTTQWVWPDRAGRRIGIGILRVPEGGLPGDLALR